MAFIAVYTNQVKSYCDEQFFNNLWKIPQDNGLVIDNSQEKGYAEYLDTISPYPVLNISVPQQDYWFLQNVVQSVSLLRDEFLKTDERYFVIIESDVIPPINAIAEMQKFLENNPKCGIVGCEYYKGFHKFADEPYQVPHALSGCTMYRRELIEKFPFRIDTKENAGAFPDAWICFDAKVDWEFWNLPIHCEHLEAEGRGDRGQGLLYN